MLVKVGDTVSEGSSLAVIEAEAGAAESAPAKTAPPADEPSDQPAARPAAAAAPVTAAAPRSLPPVDEAGFSKAHASPSVRKLARELGVNLPQVKGTGPKNRILHDDVKGFVKAILTGDGAGAAAGAGLPMTPTIDDMPMMRP